MSTKDELLKRLRSDPIYKDALSFASSPAERSKIQATTEGVIVSIASSLDILRSAIEAHMSGSSASPVDMSGGTD